MWIIRRREYLKCVREAVEEAKGSLASVAMLRLVAQALPDVCVGKRQRRETREWEHY